MNIRYGRGIFIVSRVNVTSRDFTAPTPRRIMVAEAQIADFRGKAEGRLQKHSGHGASEPN
jgi:hypothetical protein